MLQSSSSSSSSSSPLSYFPPIDRELDRVNEPDAPRILRPSLEPLLYEKARFTPPPVPVVTRVQIDENGRTYATGRRKRSTATVTLLPGSGDIRVNRRPFARYFSWVTAREQVLLPLMITERLSIFDVDVRVSGGGQSGQAGAVLHALARALVKRDPHLKLVLKKAGCLSRDPRMVESKKAGRRKARRRFQWSKR